MCKGDSTKGYHVCCFGEKCFRCKAILLATSFVGFCYMFIKNKRVGARAWHNSFKMFSFIYSVYQFSKKHLFDTL